MLVLALNLIGDQDLFDALWRALLAGIVVNVVVWRCAIVVWRHIIISPRCGRSRSTGRSRCACSASALEKLAAEQAEPTGAASHDATRSTA